MPKRKTDLFVPTGPAITFSQSNQKWNILEGVTVASGDSTAVFSDIFNGVILINKGTLLGSTEAGANAGFAVFSSDKPTIENRETGYMSGHVGVLISQSVSAYLLNEGEIFGALNGIDAVQASGLTIENHGEVTGIRSAVSMTNVALASTLIENYGTMSAKQETIFVQASNATAEIKNKASGLIENTGDGPAIVVTVGALKLNNKGTIIGGIDAGPNNANHDITNLGQISAKGDKEAISTGEGNDTVTNEGTMTTDVAKTVVFTGGGNDTVINEGTVDGGLNLSDGDDVYKNKGGKVDGRIDPGEGMDKLVLGNSKDKIDFNNTLGATNTNRVKNFETGKDKFFLEEAIFTGLTLGTLQQSEFTRGTEAKGPGPQLIYDKPNGLVWFDDDGAGGNGQVLFLELDDDTALKHDDFTVYA
ncbi:hypothetical protein [Bauldia sp.]|uniref:hypothetical protein n=1 Tax=Bauldia sp. TaxID=2575872 RepID=UPI003BABDB26